MLSSSPGMSLFSEAYEKGQGGASHTPPTFAPSSYESKNLKRNRTRSRGKSMDLFNVILESQRNRNDSLGDLGRMGSMGASFDIQDVEQDVADAEFGVGSLDISQGRREDQLFDLDLDDNGQGGDGGRPRGYSGQHHGHNGMQSSQGVAQRPRARSRGWSFGLGGALPPGPPPQGGSGVFSNQVPDLRLSLGGNSPQFPNDGGSGAFSNHAVGSFDLGDPTQQGQGGIQRPRGFSFNSERLGEPDHDSLLMGLNCQPLDSASQNSHLHVPIQHHPQQVYAKPVGLPIKDEKTSYERRQDLASALGLEHDGGGHGGGCHGGGHGGGELDSDGDGHGGQKQIGAYPPEARRAKIEKFLKKRGERVWKKKIEYDVRKDFANSRVRVGGRFVKKEDDILLRELMSMVPPKGQEPAAAGGAAGGAAGAGAVGVPALGISALLPPPAPIVPLMQ
jgi:hypothetical protein